MMVGLLVGAVALAWRPWAFAQDAVIIRECAALTAKIIAGVRGTTVDHKDTTFHFELKHPDAVAFTVHCRIPATNPGDREVPAAISISSHNSFPPASYFDLIGRAGSVLTGVPAKAIRKTAVLCHQQALADKDNYVQTKANGLTYVCNVTADYISIRKEMETDR
jgi:hypothetical protein